MTQTRPRRTHAQARAEMREAILQRGNEQLVEVGAAGLSVREIARSIGVASSAIYRHVANRDELLTLLLVDAYSDLAEAALAAGEGGQSQAAGLAALAHAVRSWAVANPARWALVYGSPVPGYSAPAQDTTEPGTRVMGAFVSLLAEPRSAPTATCSAPSPEFAALLTSAADDLGLNADAGRAADALVAWSSLVGLVSAEVFGQWGREVSPHGAELLDRWIVDTVARFGV